jgi:hypothetical protein
MICDTFENVRTVVSTCCARREYGLWYHIQCQFYTPTAEEYYSAGFEEGAEAAKPKTAGAMQREESEADGDAFFCLEQWGLR